jgi:GNAT superfamily N-acetyltransferase
MTPTLRAARAEYTPENLRAIIGLIEEASGWLSLKGTDQWQSPWPTREERDGRVRQGLESGTTWIVWAADRAVATVNAATAPSKPEVWSKADCDLSAPAVYAHRLVVARDFAGWGLGAQLIDWTGLRGHQDYGAKWIRIDVWSSNVALHEYYTKRGFKFCGKCPDRTYPSGMLFQKDIVNIAEPGSPLFAEFEPAPSPFADRGLAAAGAHATGCAFTTGTSASVAPGRGGPVLWSALAAGGLCVPLFMRPPAQIAAD